MGTSETRMETPSPKFAQFIGAEMQIQRKRPNRPGGIHILTDVVVADAAFGLGKLVKFISGERVLYEGYEDMLTTRPSGKKTEVVLDSLKNKKRGGLMTRVLIRTSSTPKISSAKEFESVA